MPFDSNKDYLPLLKQLDSDYFTRENEEEENWDTRLFTEEFLRYELATWLFDIDFRFDRQSWGIFEKMQEILGEDLALGTLENLFLSNHDT